MIDYKELYLAKLDLIGTLEALLKLSRVGIGIDKSNEERRVTSQAICQALNMIAVVDDLPPNKLALRGRKLWKYIASKYKGELEIMFPIGEIK